MAQETVRTGSTSEPDVNTYVITIFLSDIRKKTALEIEEEIRDLVEGEAFDGLVDGVLIVTSHAKSSSYSDTQPLGHSVRITG